jgi:hypothetical protein
LFTQATTMGQQKNDNDRLVMLRQTLTESKQLSTKQSYHDLLTQTNRVLTTARDNVRNQLGERVTTQQGGFAIDMQRLKLQNTLGLLISVDHSQAFCPTFEAVITGSELVVLGRHSSVEVELFRSPVDGQHDWDNLLNMAISYFVDGAAERFSEL